MQTKTIQDLTDGDIVLGTDGKWHSIRVLPIEEKQMYDFITSAGTVRCSFDHEWAVFNGKQKEPLVCSTEILSQSLGEYKGSRIGEKSGPKLLDIQSAGVEKCRCISVDTPDHQFAILTDEDNPIFTHNCTGRIVCGPVSPAASLMALDNSLGTTIKGDPKGAGIYSVNGEMTNIRFYYADQNWIKDWFHARGLDDKGYPLGEKIKERDIKLDADDEELHLPHDNITYEFQDKKKEIANQKEQHFETVK